MPPSNKLANQIQHKLSNKTVSTVNVLKFRTLYFWPKICFLWLFMQLFPKIPSGMANSVDPDQTLLQEQSDLGVHCLHMTFCQTFWFTKF